MATFCIPKHLVEDLKKSAIKGKIKLGELADMSTAERRAHFEKLTDKETSKFLNTEFEKAIASKQQDAMLDWAKSVFDPKDSLDRLKEKVAKLKEIENPSDDVLDRIKNAEKKLENQIRDSGTYGSVLAKIRSLDDAGVLSPTAEKAFLQDLVAEKLGITVSPDEVKAIAERAKKIDEAQVALGNNLGDPRFENENINFLVEKANMDKYLESLTPASRTKVFTGTIGRGAMLASVKSPLLNVTSNLLFSIPEAIGRRVGNRSFKGADNAKALDYVKFVNKVYQKTGYDLSRMTSLNDTGASGARVLGDTVHSQGKGATRWVGRVMEDIVFKQLMGAPDVAFSSAHFADSVNLGALDLAKGTDYAKRLKSLDGAEKQAFIEATKKEAQDIMTDAMRIEPQTAKGELLRAQGIMDAQYATFTNDSWASKGSLNIRKALNDVTGDIRAGDLSMPFVKTPANIVSTGIDYAGGGAVKALIDTVNVVRGGDIKSKAYMQKLGRDLTRAGFGLAAAAVIVYNLSEDDFSGAYDPARMQNNDLKNKPFNSFRIGGKWVDADYFGQLAQPVVAMMYAKKYGQGGQDSLAQYASGLMRSTVTNLPGIETVAKEFDKWSESGYKNVQEMKDAASDDIVGFLASRMVPSIFIDLAKMTDPYERKTGKGWDSLKSRIPGLRQSLPAKVNIFGDEIEGEHPLSELLFGSRVKTDKTTELVKELDKVSEASGKSLNFTDWNRTTSVKVGQFKGGLEPAEFEAAKRKYGQNLKKEVEKVMASNAYKIANDEKKAKLIGDADTDAMNQTFKDYGFKYDSDIKAIPEDKPVSKKSFIGTVVFNAKALKTDPVTYFNRMFTGEKMIDVYGDAIIVERMPTKESEAIKKDSKANTPEYKLDHNIPLSLGGSNDEDNLKIISTEQWKKNTPVEVRLYNKLKNGELSRKEAQKLIKEFKEGKITADEIMGITGGKQSRSNSGLGSLASAYGDFNRKKGELITGGLKKIADYQKGNNDLFLAGMKQDMERTNALARGETYDKPINKEAEQVYNDSLMNVAGTTSGVNTGKALAKVPLKKLSGLGKALKSKLDDVLVEAKKYKSADDFIKSQHKIAEYSPLTKENANRSVKMLNDIGIPVKSGEDIVTLYHGTNAKGVKGISDSKALNPGSYMATDKKVSEGFVFGSGGKVLEIKVPVKDAGFITPPMAGSKGVSVQNPVKLVQGKDGVYRAEVWKSKAELADTWERAKSLEVLEEPIKIFHTTSAGVKGNILKDGFKKGSELAEDAFRGGGYGQVQDSISFATTKKSSSIFANSGNNTMFSTTLKKGSKVIDLPNVESAEELNDLVPKLLEEGVDAVRIGSGEDEIVVISKKALGGIDEAIDFKATDAKNLFKDTAEKAKKVVLPKAKTATTIPRSAIHSGVSMGANVKSKLLDELAKVPGVSPAEIQKALPRFGSVNYRKATESITAAIKKSRPNATDAEIEDIIYKALSNTFAVL